MSYMVKRKNVEDTEEDSMEGYVTQAEAAAQKEVDLPVLNAWVRRGRVRSKLVFGRRVVYLPDVMAYDPSANKGGRGRKAAHEKK